MDQEVRHVGEQGVVVALVELLGGPPRLAHRHPHQPCAGRDALLAHHRPGERLRGQQQRRVGGDRDLALQADLLEHQPRLLVPHHDVVHLRQHRAHRVPVLGVRERPGADGVGERGHAPGLRGAHQPQVAPRLTVVEDPAAAQHEEVEAGQHVQDVVAADPLPGHHLVGAGVVRAGVLRVAAQDDEVRAGAQGAQTAQDAGEDRLVTGVEAAVGAEHADARAPAGGGRMRGRKSHPELPSRRGRPARAGPGARCAAQGAGLPAGPRGNTLITKDRP